MRKRFEVQYELGATPIEKLEIPSKSRDEMPPVLRALQYIYNTPELNQKVFELLEAKVMTGKKQTGRYGMTLWEILVLAAIRLTRDADYDHLHYMTNTDNLIRGLLGVCKFGESDKDYPLQTIKDNVDLIDEETINQVNELVIESGHQLLKKNDRLELEVKIDSYVLESNVHFPTDINLLYDAARKCIDLARGLAGAANLSGWRKAQYWINRFKAHCHKVGKLLVFGGQNKHHRLSEATDDYLTLARQLSQKLQNAHADFKNVAETSCKTAKLFEQLLYFKAHLDKHIDLIGRRILNGEQIPHSEKVFSLFETYTEWIKKSKASNRPELGLNIVVAMDQFRFILFHQVMQHQHDEEMAVPTAKALLKKYDIHSLSFDRNYWSKNNYETLSLLVAHLVMPKKGKLNQLEYEREHSKTFLALRKQHSAVESGINSLEHHGLNRCPDHGISHFKKYTALGILAYNLHKLGDILLEKDRKSISKNTQLKKAA